MVRGEERRDDGLPDRLQRHRGAGGGGRGRLIALRRVRFVFDFSGRFGESRKSASDGGRGESRYGSEVSPFAVGSGSR